MPSIISLLTGLAGALIVFWLVVIFPLPAAIMVFVVGALAFSVIPGMQTRVLTTAKNAPTLGIALNASGFQIAAAFSAWFGGRVIDSEWGLGSLALVGACLTVAGIVVAFASLVRDGK